MSELREIEYTLFEASQRWGVSMRWLSQAVAEGKVEARLTTEKQGYKKNGVPVYVVTAAAMKRFKANFTTFHLQGVGSSRANRKPVDARRTDAADEIVLKRRKEIEDRKAAKELGVSYEEYMTYVL